MSTTRPAPERSNRKPAAGGPAPAGQEKILAALRELGTASAAAISTHTGLAYSTTTAKLRAMAAAGQACRQRHPDGTTTWTPADVPPADTTTAGTTTAGTTTAGKPSTAKAGKSRPAAVSKGKPATGSRKHKPTTTARADTAEGSGSDTDRPDPGSGTSAAAAASATTATVVATGDTQPDPGSPDKAAKRSRGRRAKGQLRAQVLAVLQNHPEVTFKVSQVCKQLPGASAGAIANALDKLVADGTARQVADKPATYQAE